jgi:uroporphyrinogen-III synthase
VTGKSRKSMAVLITRPQPAASQTAARLKALQLTTHLAPLFEFAALATPPPQPGATFDGLVLTSANGLRALLARTDWPQYKALPVWCVGPTTRQLIENSGLDIAGHGKNLDALAAGLRAARPRHLLYPGARHLSANLDALLEDTGHTLVAWPIYAMNTVTDLPGPTLAALKNGKIDAVLLYSKRAATVFMRLCATAGLDLAEVAAICLSPAIAHHLPDGTFTQRLAASAPHEQSMIELVGAFANGQIGT